MEGIMQMVGRNLEVIKCYRDAKYAPRDFHLGQLLFVGISEPEENSALML